MFGQIVSTRLYPASVVVVAEDMIVARHDRLSNAGETRFVLTAGLDAVLVAVEVALETGPTGKVSVEHVVNVLARLNATPAPPTATTQLQASTPPLPNTARYDSLRAGSAEDANSASDDTVPSTGATSWAKRERCSVLLRSQHPMVKGPRRWSASNRHRGGGSGRRGALLREVKDETPAAGRRRGT